MIPTFIGLAIAAIGLLLLFRGSVASMFALLMGCTLMPGSAALLLPALGGSTIPPVQFAMVFMIVRLVIGHPRLDLVREAVVRNLALLCYAAYGVVIAYIGPRMFQSDMYVFPMRMTASGLGSHTVALAPSAQNLTSSVYLVGTLLISICASAAVLHAGGIRRIVSTACVMAWIHVFLGVTGSVFSGTAWSRFLDTFRNASYAQTDQNFGSISRIKGIAPEPSSYAMIAFVWFVFLFECWVRDVMPRRTGLAAGALALVLVFSTSSTAYLGLGAYGILFAVRTMMIPGSVQTRKMLVLAGCAGLAMLGVIAIYLLVPSFAAMFGDMINSMTVGKTGSDSAAERQMWAAQGIAAFKLSHGLGIGPGSFRSSSFVTAIIGTTGIIGAVCFLIHLVRVFGPFRASTYVRLRDGAQAVGVAGSWAAMAIMIPSALITAGGDPGPEFAITAGVALALRWRAARSPADARQDPSASTPGGRRTLAA